MYATLLILYIQEFHYVSLDIRKKIKHKAGSNKHKDIRNLSLNGKWV